MSDIFISYARSTADQAQAVAEALRALGYGVWRDDDLPAHRAYTEVIEERLRSAKAVVVVWSTEAAKSQWVRAEADLAREAGTLVQLTVDGASLPLPFNQIQCADLTGWSGDTETPGWRKVVASIADLVSGVDVAAPPVAGAPLPLPGKPSIAVMPFANLSGDPEQEYFADGMVVEIVEALSRIRAIFVIASGSSLSFKGKGVNARDAARQLGVHYVLEGSVRRAGGRVRIGVQLIDATDGAQIWTHRFEDTLEDVFALQDRVALAVAGKIEPTVQSAEIRRASARPTDNLGSYDLYLRALPMFRSFRRAGVAGALELLHRAIALDPKFAPALAWAGNGHRLRVAYGWSDDPEADRRQGLELTHRALKAAGEDAAVFALVAQNLFNLERDFGAASVLLERAIALNPGCAQAWFMSGAVRVRAGEEIDLAIEHLETALRLDPMGSFRPNATGWIGRARFQQGRFGEAVTLLKEMIQQSELPMGPAFLAASYGHLGHASEARTALAHFVALSPHGIGAYAAADVWAPAENKLFLDGIALADGDDPADGAAPVS